MSGGSVEESNAGQGSSVSPCETNEKFEVKWADLEDDEDVMDESEHSGDSALHQKMKVLGKLRLHRKQLNPEFV